MKSRFILLAMFVTWTANAQNNGKDPELIFNPIQSEKSFANCFPGKGRAKIKLRQFEYKNVYDPDLKKTIRLRAYVFSPSPARGKKMPVIAMFHGGGWRSGNPTMWFPQALYLASRGSVAISFQYRIEGVHGHPSAANPNFIERAINDSRSAMYWLRENATKLGIDPERVVTAGDSAGGYLAAVVSIINSIPGEAPGKTGIPILPKAIIPVYPVVVMEHLDDGPGKPEISFPNLSLPRLAPKDLNAKIHIILGAADDNSRTKPANAAAFCKAIPSCSIRIFQEPAGQAEGKITYFHGFMGVPQQYRRMMLDMDSFLSAQGVFTENPFSSAGRFRSAQKHCIAKEAQEDQWTKEFGYADHGGVW